MLRWNLLPKRPGHSCLVVAAALTIATATHENTYWLLGVPVSLNVGLFLVILKSWGAAMQTLRNHVRRASMRLLHGFTLRRFFGLLSRPR